MWDLLLASCGLVLLGLVFAVPLIASIIMIAIKMMTLFFRVSPAMSDTCVLQMSASSRMVLASFTAFSFVAGPRPLKNPGCGSIVAHVMVTLVTAPISWLVVAGSLEMNLFRGAGLILLVLLTMYSAAGVWTLYEYWYICRTIKHE